jgi:hypothetical protein
MGKVFKVRNVLSDHVDAMKSLLSYADGGVGGGGTVHP